MRSHRFVMPSPRTSRRSTRPSRSACKRVIISGSSRKKCSIRRPFALGRPRRLIHAAKGGAAPPELLRLRLEGIVQRPAGQVALPGDQSATRAASPTLRPSAGAGSHRGGRAAPPARRRCARRRRNRRRAAAAAGAASPARSRRRASRAARNRGRAARAPARRAGDPSDTSTSASSRRWRPAAATWTKPSPAPDRRWCRPAPGGRARAARGR